MKASIGASSSLTMTLLPVNPVIITGISVVVLTEDHEADHASFDKATVPDHVPSCKALSYPQVHGNVTET